jgi:hypothetical protein
MSKNLLFHWLANTLLTENSQQLKHTGSPMKMILPIPDCHHGQMREEERNCELEQLLGIKEVEATLLLA